MASFYKYGVLTRAQKKRIAEKQMQLQESADGINWEVAKIQLKAVDQIEMAKEKAVIRDCTCCGHKFEERPAQIPEYIQNRTQLARWGEVLKSRRTYVRTYLWVTDQAKFMEEARRDGWWLIF